VLKMLNVHEINDVNVNELLELSTRRIFSRACSQRRNFIKNLRLEHKHYLIAKERDWSIASLQLYSMKASMCYKFSTLGTHKNIDDYNYTM